VPDVVDPDEAPPDVDDPDEVWASAAGAVKLRANVARIASLMPAPFAGNVAKGASFRRGGMRSRAGAPRQRNRRRPPSLLTDFSSESDAAGDLSVMKAMLSKAIGGPDTLVLEELPDPTPNTGEVVIAVKACGVNYPDLLIIEDRSQYKPARPFAPGGEVAGIVEAVGSGVSGLKAGDRVIGSSMWGGMAEKLALKADRCIPFPDSMPMDEAAAMMLTYGTSIYALKDRAKLLKGETLLVLGAAGGVGLSAVELGKAMGARVIAAASSEEKVALAKKHGASDGVVYPAGPFDKAGSKALADLFKKACGETGANVIYDPVGGDYSEAALRAVAWEGRFLVVGFPAGIPRLPLNLTLLKSCQVVGVFWGEFTRRDPAGNAANIRALMQFYADGAIRPLVSERYPLEQAGAAIAKLAARQAMGKIVVTME
jgi:NADPH2:quinone reductase